MTLRVVGSDIYEMDRGTYMWIQVTYFAIDGGEDDRSLLASLIASPGYAHDYASPLDAAAVVTEPAVHGRWWRSRINADLYESWTAADAEALLWTWANDQEEWADVGFRQPPAVEQRLRSVFALLAAGHLYKLRNPEVQDEHECGWVGGRMGFHEFVVVDRRAHRVCLVVASDD